MKKDARGNIHFKIVLVGPSLAGKTTTLRWLYENLTSIRKGSFTDIKDGSGRTSFFDFTPFFITNRLHFDIYTVAGQDRHKNTRLLILKEVDGLMFIADSSATMQELNRRSAEELKGYFREKLIREIPLVVCLNKRDVIDAVSTEVMIQNLDFGPNVPYIETIATKGIGLKRAFQTLSKLMISRYL